MAGPSKNNKRSQPTTIIKVGANEMGKLPPQAQELEDSVLGAVMIEKDAYGTVADLLRPEVFYKDQNRIVYEAIRELAAKDQPIDLVVSGINHGSNAAINVIYSGTMGACLVAAEKGIPAIGWSINSHLLDADLHWLQPFLTDITQHLLEEGITPGTCYNINAPLGEIEGIRWTRQCRGHWANELVEATDEPLREGILSTWRLAGEFINDEPQAQDTDIWAMDHQLLAITPISIDLTDYGSL